jgi:hypothetical protein
MKCHVVLKSTVMVTYGNGNRALSSRVKGEGHIYKVPCNFMSVLQDLIPEVILSRNVIIT